MAETKEKKPRKTRKDKGIKRGKRKIKNPRLQTGSIDFRTIGTQQTFGPNLTSLVGSIASLSRPVQTTLIPNQPTTYTPTPPELSLVKSKPRDIIETKTNPSFSFTKNIMEEKIGDVYEKNRRKEVQKALTNRLENERRQADYKIAKIREEVKQAEEQQGMMNEDIAGQLKQKSSLLEQARYQSELLGNTPRIMFGNEPGYKYMEDASEEELQQLEREFLGGGAEEKRQKLVEDFLAMNLDY